jgi:FAD/FMN-containing dehydrogenase
VKLSGYLLGGGMSWNQTVWGTGMESVEAIELVTAAGELITASATENSEYFWAARGAGSGFFGVVTRYHLKLHPLPGAIHGSTYYFSLDDAPAVAKWLGEIADSLSPAVELSIFLLEAPANLRKKVADHAGKICMVTAAAFADTEQEAKSCLQPLENGPLAAKCLSGEFATPLDFEKLFDASGALWPSGLRNRVEAMFFNAAPEDLVEAVHTHVAKSPSQITLTLFVIYAGPAVPAPLPDTAFSMSAKIYAGPWTMWKDEADDDANTAWHNECVKLLQPHIYGHYVGESDTVTYPAHAVGCFSSANWHRLADLRDKYDPDGVFFGYFDGLNSETS